MTYKTMPFLTRGRIGGFALVLAGMMLCSPAHADVADCTAPEEGEIAGLFDHWNTALQTLHPDKVTRVYAADATLLDGLSSTPYMGHPEIRGHYLYFLQREPQLRVVSRAIRIACNTATDVGTAALTMRSKRAAGLETVIIRYSIVHEFREGAWLIAHQHLSIAPDGASGDAGPYDKRAAADSALIPKAAHHKAPAVAGFTRRSASARSASPKPAARQSTTPLLDELGITYKPADWSTGSPVF